MIYDLQKPTLWKRLSAYLFDLILLAIIAVMFATVTSMVVDFDGKVEVLTKAYDAYAEEYGIELNISSEDFAKLTKEEQQAYTDANNALQKDESVLAIYHLIFNLVLIITASGILLAVLIWEFIIPVLLKNGQTVGKKIFGVAVMRTNGVKVSPVAIFIRAILGKYTFEIMVPVFSLILLFFGNMATFGLIITSAVLIAQIISLSVTKTRSALHDLLADTVTVDLQSQLIFENEDELIKYKEKAHAEKVEKSTY